MVVYRLLKQIRNFGFTIFKIVIDAAYLGFVRLRQHGDEEKQEENQLFHGGNSELGVIVCVLGANLLHSDDLCNFIQQKVSLSSENGTLLMILSHS